MTYQAQPNGLDVETINPSRGAKYSPNLFRWITKPGAAHRSWMSRVYRAEDGTLWIGHVDDQQYLSGTRLMAVLCNGAKQETMAYRVGAHFPTLKEITDFWARYTRDGRCALDVDHAQFFIGDETRWQTNGDARTCLWCGNATQTLKRYTEAVPREEWASA